MFGYINIHPAELKIKDYESYHAFYCGLCRSLKSRHGLAAQTTLSYDMTFLGILLSALYEAPCSEKKIFCPFHPAQKQTVRSSHFMDYAADMNLLLAYYDRMDDWYDDHNLKAKAQTGLLSGSCRKLKEQYPRQAKAVEDYVKDLSELEKAPAEDSGGLDAAAGLTGRMFSEIFVPEEDVWAPYLRQIGFYLGKYIYLLDAYEDLEKDSKKNRYNPWRSGAKKRSELREEAQDVLTMMMSECSLAFEHLPILEYADILRNILYAGVWTRFEAINKKDDEEAEKAGKGGTSHGL